MQSLSTPTIRACSPSGGTAMYLEAAGNGAMHLDLPVRSGASSARAQGGDEVRYQFREHSNAE